MGDDPAAILVVEDESPIRQAIATKLRSEGYAVLEASSVTAAKQNLATSQVALVLLDLGMPDGSGLDLLRTLEQPVIVVSGQTSETDRVVGLELGADDYVSKPFSSRELVARVRCVLRRNGNAAHATDDTDVEPVISFPGLTVDPRRREVTVGGADLHLTPMEFDLLHWLAAHPRRVFSKSHLLRCVWQCEDEWVNEATVTEHVRRLRAKLRRGAQPQIVTVWGVGYRFEPEPRPVSTALGTG